MLRIFLGIGTVAMSRYPLLTFDEVYTASAWAGILVSSVVAEWFIVQRKIDGTRSRTPSPRAVSSPR
jgi:hypothetical protein